MNEDIFAQLDAVYQEVKDNPVEGGFTPIPDGEYEGAVLSVEMTTSKKNKPMAKVVLGLDVDGKTKKENMFYVFDGKMLEQNMTKFRKLMVKLGTPEYLSFSETIEAAQEDVVGKDIVATIDSNEWDRVSVELNLSSPMSEDAEGEGEIW